MAGGQQTWQGAALGDSLDSLKEQGLLAVAGAGAGGREQSKALEAGQAGHMLSEQHLPQKNKLVLIENYYSCTNYGHTKACEDSTLITLQICLYIISWGGAGELTCSLQFL